MFIIIIIIYLIIGIVEMYPLYKKNQKKELILYSVLFFVAFVMSLLLSLGIEIPSPADGIEKIVKGIVG